MGNRHEHPRTKNLPCRSPLRNEEPPAFVPRQGHDQISQATWPMRIRKRREHPVFAMGQLFPCWEIFIRLVDWLPTFQSYNAHVRETRKDECTSPPPPGACSLRAAKPHKKVDPSPHDTPPKDKTKSFTLFRRGSGRVPGLGERHSPPSLIHNTAAREGFHEHALNKKRDSEREGCSSGVPRFRTPSISNCFRCRTSYVSGKASIPYPPRAHAFIDTGQLSAPSCYRIRTPITTRPWSWHSPLGFVPPRSRTASDAAPLRIRLTLDAVLLSSSLLTRSRTAIDHEGLSVSYCCRSRTPGATRPSHTGLRPTTGGVSGVVRLRCLSDYV